MNTTLPTDALLPHLHQALDPARMAQAFAAALAPRGTQVQHCALERVKYRPGRNATLAYRLQLLDARHGQPFVQYVAARLCSRNEAARRAHKALAATAAPLLPSAAGPATQWLQGLDMVTWWWPNDAWLAAPRLLAAPGVLHGQVWPALLQALGHGPQALGHSPQVLEHAALELVQYVPEQRLCLRATLHLCDGRQQQAYAKASREPDVVAAHALLSALNRSPAVQAGALQLPRALLCQPALQLHWQSALPGRTLLERPADEAVAWASRLGAQLAALHGTPLALPRRLDGAALRERLHAAGQLLAAALPAAAALVQATTAGLQAGLGLLDDEPAATLHGDLHPRNLLAHDGRLGLIDLDGLRQGPAVLELGAWLADGIYRALLAGAHPLRDAPAWQALLDSYARHGGHVAAPATLAWAVACNLVAPRAQRCVANLKPGRFVLAQPLVALAQRLLQARSLEALA